MWATTGVPETPRIHGTWQKVNTSWHFGQHCNWNPPWSPNQRIITTTGEMFTSMQWRTC